MLTILLRNSNEMNETLYNYFFAKKKYIYLFTFHMEKWEFTNETKIIFANETATTCHGCHVLL